MQANVADPTGEPYFYGGNATGANLFTNTSISVDSRVTTDTLTKYLDTGNVEQAIAADLSGCACPLARPACPLACVPASVACGGPDSV